MPMDVQRGRHLVAVVGLAAGHQVEGMSPLSFLAVGFLLHAPYEFGGALGEGGHLLAHLVSLSTAEEAKDTRIMYSQPRETV
jgi:hypothetical protein